VYQIYVGFKQAYDSVQRKKLYTVMYEFGLPPKLVRLVTPIMTGTEAQVKVQAELTDTFEIRQGPKQGDGLAPVFFQSSTGICDQEAPS
jgi:sorting nexin-29